MQTDWRYASVCSSKNNNNNDNTSTVIYSLLPGLDFMVCFTYNCHSKDKS